MRDSESSSPAADIWSVQDFYNQMAETYHFTAGRYEERIQAEWPILQRIVANTLGDGVLRVLDCACGVGTQLLGLAQYGHQAVGSDFSTAAIRRARREATARGLCVWLNIADMRALPFRAGVFDVVICADNALSHLLSNDSMFRAVAEMCRVLRPGGLVVITTRDYDSLRPQRTAGTYPFVLPTSQGRVIVFQVWSWHADGERYDLEHFELMPDGHEDWRVHRFSTRFWAVSRAQLNEALTTAGLVDPRWYECNDSGYYQPIVTARRPA
jgi:SAM-dependent methyltransferase